jgi:hypothetical protein
MPAKLTLADRATREQFRTAVRSVARAQLGKHEDPPGSNRTPYGLWYGLDGHPWCAMWVSWVYAQAAAEVGCENPLAGVQSLRGFAHVTTAFTQMRRRGWVLNPGERPMAGDVVCWDADARPGGPGHTGIVVRVRPDTVDVVEGNTDGAQSRTGGIVMTHSHDIDGPAHGRLLGYARPTRRYGR